ncbi:hypothetical protein K3495_g16004, partial [Podosphaera aphanis]
MHLGGAECKGSTVLRFHALLSLIRSRPDESRPFLDRRTTTSSTMDDLETLELLSLVSKVTSELQNHLGIYDKTLAEFIIAQHAQCTSLDEFQKKLEGMGADLPQSLIESIDRLVKTLHPKYQGKGARDGNGNESEEKTKVFKGLALPDKVLPWMKDPESFYASEVIKGESDAIDDTLALLEGLEPKAKSEKRANTRLKRSRSPEDDYKRGRIKKERNRSRTRSRDEGRGRRKDFEEE